jgi:hypothetical protein
MPIRSLRCASQSEVGWLVRFSRERSRGEGEVLELGLEPELLVMSASSIMLLITYADVDAVGVSTT